MAIPSSILIYLCRLQCTIEVHCYKGCDWLCKSCKNHSTWLSFVYTINNQSHCIMHYQSNQSIPHYFIVNIITLFNVHNNKKKEVPLNGEVNLYAESISVWSKIYIIGGNCINSTFEVDINLKMLKALSSMLVMKFTHTLCKGYGFIYSIGGYDSTTYIKDCDKYSIIDNQRNALPSLFIERGGCAAFAFNIKGIVFSGGS